MVRSSYDESTPLMSDHRDDNPSRDDAHPDAPIPDQASRLEMADSDGTTATDDSRAAQKRPSRIPFVVRRLWKSAERWTHGPPSPRDYKITPLLARVQEFPLYVVDRFIPRRRHRLGLVGFFFAIWIVTFALVKRKEVYASDIEGWGDPQTISCGATYWSRGNNCGLDGGDCRPFNGSGFPFRCPANCRSYHVLNPRAVGNQTAIYQPLVIGGPSDEDGGAAVYRGDSYICGSAIHAGVVSNDAGGCGVVTLVGRRDSYESSRRSGITSIGFDSYFPLSFTFMDEVACRAKDMRWPLLAISVVCTSLLSLFTASPGLFFFGTFVGVFWHVGLASDPPPHWSIPDLISKLAGRFLPVMFCAWVMFDKMGVRRTLGGGLTAQIEKTVLWLGGCWVGALENYTLAWIPIQRLNSHDLEQQPGAKGALAGIIIALVIVAGSQVYFLRQEGRLTKYLKLYALFVVGIVICLVLPDLNFRLHHYVLALLLLPGTAIQIRPSLLYQGLLIGLFLNGVARWGFDPVLQTDFALQGDAQHNNLLPILHEPVIDLSGNTSTIRFRWDDPPEVTYDGISVLVNDVERFRGFYDDATTRVDEFEWKRPTDQGLNEYFRFGYMDGRQGLDYTQAGVWTAEGEWVEMAPGPSEAGGTATGTDTGEGEVNQASKLRRV